MKYLHVERQNPNNWGESLTRAKKSENVLFSPTFFTPAAFLGRKSSSEKSLSEKFFAGLFLVAFFGLSSSESSVDFFFGLAAFLGLVSFGGFSVKGKNFEQLILALPGNTFNSAVESLEFVVVQFLWYLSIALAQKFTSLTKTKYWRFGFPTETKYRRIHKITSS